MQATKESTNPYAKFLGSADPLEVTAATPEKLRKLTAHASQETLNRRPAPGKWSIRDILCHLADTEIAFAFRIRQALSQSHHVIQPFDQDDWAKPYDHFGLADALEAFSALRKWNLLLIKSAVPSAWSKPLSHPERGEMTFQTLIETMGGHDLNHLGQIEALTRTA